LSADATSTALADDAPREPVVVDEVEEVLEVTGTGDGSLAEVVVDEIVLDVGEG
jgi:hypothetical protein